MDDEGEGVGKTEGARDVVMGRGDGYVGMDREEGRQVGLETTA